MKAVRHIGLANNERSIVFYRLSEFIFATEADLNMESPDRENLLTSRIEALRRAHPS